ncbi:MAG: carbonic anhydrase [Flavobacteriales bacterium]|nr:MAG: carbonic anhydrase [Flavobacteriales bacterium]
MKTQTKETQEAVTPEGAMEILKEGNARFVQNLQTDRNLPEQVQETAKGQYPFAVILSCIDSRIPAEMVFDQGIGDIFSIRIAGNFINEDILGSMEFACKAAGSKLIVVMGHSSCGAVKGACDHVELGNLTGLLSKIQPAIDSVEEAGERTSVNKEFVQKVAYKNVEISMRQLKEKSPVLKEMLDNGEIGLVGAMYSVETGEVTFVEL